MDRDLIPCLREVLKDTRKEHSAAIFAPPQVFLKHTQAMTRLNAASREAGFVRIQCVTDISALALFYAYGRMKHKKKDDELWNNKAVIFVAVDFGFHSVGYAVFQKDHTIRVRIARSVPSGFLDGVALLMQTICNEAKIVCPQQPLLWEIENYQRAPNLLTEMIRSYSDILSYPEQLFAYDITKRPEFADWLKINDELEELSISVLQIQLHIKMKVFVPICAAITELLKSIKDITAEIRWTSNELSIEWFDTLIKEAGSGISCLGMDSTSLSAVAEGLAFYMWAQQQDSPPFRLIEELE